MKRFVLLLTLVGLLLLLVGCGAESLSEANGKGYDAEEGYTVADGLASSTQSGEAAPVTNQKLIRTVHLEAETEEMDALLANVEGRIAALGGYVENRNVYNGGAGSLRSRSASLTIRIPAEQLDQFVEQVSGVSNVISHSENSKDVTLAYVATESRITALETEQTRLLELLAEAKDMSDLLALEGKLTDVRTELEQYKSQLRLYDNQVNYATVHLTITEVKEYTVVEEEEPSFWARLWTGFTGAIKTVWMLTKEIVIFLVTAVPFLVLPALILTAILLPKRLRRKKQKKQEETKE